MGKALLRGLFLAMIVFSLSAPTAQATIITSFNSGFTWKSFGLDSHGRDVGIWISEYPFWWLGNNDAPPAPVTSFILPFIPTGTTNNIGGWNEPGGYGSDSGCTTGVPEPTTMLLLGSGLIGLVGFRRKFRRKFRK